MVMKSFEIFELIGVAILFIILAIVCPNWFEGSENEID